MENVTSKNLGNDNLSKTNVIARSNALIQAENNPYSLGSLKVLDTYLSKINPFDVENRTVAFTKSEYEHLLGISKIPKSRLSLYTDELQKQLVKLPVKDDPTGYKSIVLFESALVHNVNGQTVVELMCSKSAQELFFNLSGIRYIKYQLGNVINLQSVNSLYLYYYLLDCSYNFKTWQVDIVALKKAIHIDDTCQYYADFKRFNNKVLKKAVDEINNKTNIKVDYEVVLNGKTAVAINFTVLETDHPELYSESDESGKELDNSIDIIINNILAQYVDICKSLVKDTERNEELDTKIVKLYQNGIDFKKLFTTAEKSDFLTGRNDNWKGKRCGLKWILDHYKDILAGYYDDNEKPAYKSDASYDLAEIEKMGIYIDDPKKASYDIEELEKIQ
jgi:plasmid replication initiation protein